MCVHFIHTDTIHLYTCDLSLQGQTVDAGPSPPDYFHKQLSFLPPVLYDSVPSGQTFGAVNKDASDEYCVVSINLIQYMYYTCTHT